MNVSDFDFELPPASIAQRPAPRGTSRLMTLGRTTGAIAHRTIADLPELIQDGDVVVLNDTKVLPARLFGEDEAGRRTELLLVEEVATERWTCLARPGRRLQPGRRFTFGEDLVATVVEKKEGGTYLVEFSGPPVLAALPRLGTAPLPPYIRRPSGLADARDASDYQTVYAEKTGAIAAPTAGLHFTPELLAEIGRRGAEVVRVTLHVGLGTFRPVKVERMEDHVMDEERGEIPEKAALAVNGALREGRRVVAVGTTTVRTLEASAQRNGGIVAPGAFRTRLFLTPGAPFDVVGGLLTNFHLPRSTLLMLVAAFAGREHVLDAYRDAVGSGYRFFSYGDAMFVA